MYLISASTIYWIGKTVSMLEIKDNFLFVKKQARTTDEQIKENTNNRVFIHITLEKPKKVGR